MGKNESKIKLLVHDLRPPASDWKYRESLGQARNIENPDTLPKDYFWRIIVANGFANFYKLTAFEKFGIKLDTMQLLKWC